MGPNFVDHAAALPVKRELIQAGSRPRNGNHLDQLYCKTLSVSRQQGDFDQLTYGIVIGSMPSHSLLSRSFERNSYPPGILASSSRQSLRMEKLAASAQRRRVCSSWGMACCCNHQYKKATGRPWPSRFFLDEPYAAFVRRHVLGCPLIVQCAMKYASSP